MSEQREVDRWEDDTLGECVVVDVDGCLYLQAERDGEFGEDLGAVLGRLAELRAPGAVLVDRAALESALVALEETGYFCCRWPGCGAMAGTWRELAHPASCPLREGS